MQHLRKAHSTSRSLLSLIKTSCDLTAARTLQAEQILVSRQLISSCCLASQQTPFACLHYCWLPQDLQSHPRADLRAPPSGFVCSRGFASQSASRLKQSAARAKRIARQQHGGRGGPVTDAVDPTSNEAVDTIPQDQSSVQASQSQASDLQVEDVVGHPALVITRNVEWGTVIFGFEQANKYTIYDQEGNVVALLAEELGSFGKEVGRQLLRTRRPFTATVFSPDGGQVIFKVRRPFYFINSSIFVEDGEGNTIGEVQQRWHLWQRNYDLYIDRKQYATINSGLWAWEFLLKDKDGGPMALIDRNFQGFGKELFTDAGKYVIHFGDKPMEAASQATKTIQAAHPDKPAPAVTAVAKYRNPDMQVIATSTADQLVVQRPLMLSERMVALAAAVSVDYDYFSQHSQGSGWFAPMMFPPVPYPSGGGAEGGAEGAEGGDQGQGEAVPGDAGAAAAGTGASSSADAGSAGGDSEFGSPQPGSEFSPEQPMEGDLGGDEFDLGQTGGAGGEGELGSDMDLGGGGDDGDGGGLFTQIWDVFSNDD
ncbi:TPA: hypothetical protein ACH3X2_010794 [Trebouxia sp. C0005]